MGKESFTVKLTTKRVSQLQLDKFRDFLNDCANLSTELDWSNEPDNWDDYPSLYFLKEYDLSGLAIQSLLSKIREIPFEIILFNLQVLLDNCADLDNETLDFNKRIDQGFEAVKLLQELEKKVNNPYTKSAVIKHSREFHKKIVSVLDQYKDEEIKD